MSKKINTPTTFRISDDARTLIQKLAAHFTLKTGAKHSTSAVVEMAVQMLADREKLK